jgi:type I restriction enzyme S subunit
LSPKNGTSIYFLYYLLKASLDQMKSLSYGTVFETITMKTFDEISVTNPEQKIIQSFNDFVKPFFCRIKTNTQESNTLGKIRDLLLPKLMYGKIRVPIIKEKMESAIRA